MSTMYPITVKIVNMSKKIEEEKSTTDWYIWTLSVIIAPTEFLEKEIECVVYHLHPSFPTNTIKLKDKHKNFELISKGWGEVNVKVDIILIDQRKVTLNHYLSLTDPTGSEKNQTVIILNEDDFKKVRINFRKKAKLL
jgi:transcription initiation factor IIF auxiliary subunit